jgi:hypothetical protein
MAHHGGDQFLGIGANRFGFRFSCFNSFVPQQFGNQISEQGAAMIFVAAE